MPPPQSQLTIYNNVYLKRKFITTICQAVHVKFSELTLLQVPRQRLESGRINVNEWRHTGIVWLSRRVISVSDSAGLPRYPRPSPRAHKAHALVIGWEWRMGFSHVLSLSLSLTDYAPTPHPHPKYTAYKDPEHGTQHTYQKHCCYKCKLFRNVRTVSMGCSKAGNDK